MKWNEMKYEMEYLGELQEGSGLIGERAWELRARAYGRRERDHMEPATGKIVGSTHIRV